jgi:hypothetical protein
MKEGDRYRDSGWLLFVSIIYTSNNEYSWCVSGRRVKERGVLLYHTAVYYNTVLERVQVQVEVRRKQMVAV